MADKISASITYLDTNQNKGSKAVTDISPTADNGAIRNFCIGLLGLTTNTLSQIDRVEKTDITNAATKPKLSLTLNTTDTFMFNMSNPSVGDERNTDIFNQISLPAFSYKVEGDAGLLYNFCVSVYETGGHVCYATGAGEIESTSETVTLTIYFEETETTAATTAQIAINYSGQPTLTIL